MPSRRYYIAMAPVEHINGKMAPVSVKCKNTTDSAAVEVAGFWYGYKHKNCNTSHFGIRTNCRDLNTNPYTAAEIENRTLFTMALQAVNAHRDIAADWALMLADYNKQSTYITPNGFAVALCRENGGYWLDDWTA